MSVYPKLLAFGVPVLLVFLTALAGYAYSQIRFLSLPIPQALGLFTVVLPLITGISTQGVYGLIKRSSKGKQYQLTIPLVAVIGFQLIYETVIATLALNHILPPDALVCGLESTWKKLYGDKNQKAIRAIQDSFECCGFRSVVDKAYPFTDHKPSPCAEIFGRSRSCFGAWREAEQVNAGLFLLVAVIVFIIKVLSVISLLTSSSWAHPSWGRAFKRRTSNHTEDAEEDSGTGTRRLIEEGAADEAYHDEPDSSTQAIEEPATNSPNQGPRVVPSHLIDNGNEWRGEGENR